MTDGALLGVDLSRTTYDTVDGETMVLDFETGVLLLLVGNGPLIWERLVGGVDREELLRDIIAAYGTDAATDAAAFVDQLVNAGSVTTIEGSRRDPESAPSPTPWPDTYTPPQIERYDDIADIMTMDPIHEVDPALGWPHPRDRDAPDSA
jgi:hypothetical protein